MGWYSWHSASDITFNELLTELSTRLTDVKAGEDGLVHIEITIKGDKEEKLTFEAKNPSELVDMLKLNIK